MEEKGNTIKKRKPMPKREIAMKTYKSRSGWMVAAADLDVLDMELFFNGTRVHINPRFYLETKVSYGFLLKALRNSVSANLFGKLAVKAGVESGVIEEGNIIKIKNIPHAQGVVMKVQG